VSGYHEYPRCHAKSDELGFAKVVVCAEVAAAAPVELSEAAHATNCKYNRTHYLEHGLKTKDSVDDG